MKCIILAGGSGDRLWPISRRNFPKQFLEISKGRSMFQEAVLRNMAFCEEFIIITNTIYANIVKNQLSVFQEIKFSLILESAPLKTAPSLVRTLMNLNPDEEVLIVSCDYMISGNYNEDVVLARKRINENKIIALVVEPKNTKDGYHFLRKVGNQTVFENEYSPASYWETGVFITKVATFLNATNSSFLEKCQLIKIFDNFIICDNEEDVALRLSQVLNTEMIDIHISSFECDRMFGLSSLYDFLTKQTDYDSNSIINGQNVEVINANSKQLVVVNDINDIVVANTKDAIYISSIKSEWNNKSISKEADELKKYFDTTTKIFYSWGSSERIDKTGHTKINNVTIHSGATASFTRNFGYSYNFVVASGKIEVDANGTLSTYEKNDAFSIPKKCRYVTIRNLSSKDSRLVEIIDRINDDENVLESFGFFKMQPVYKDFIWGGTKIRDVLGKETPGYDTVAEAWELSAHKEGQSIIGSGSQLGMKFGEYVNGIGKKTIGWKAQNYYQFPIMIKFIDATRNLSIQVHPKDEYALTHEKDYGKNEMWYIMDAKKDAFIYIGFKKECTAEEIKKRIENKTIVEVLNKIRVKPGETYYIEAGTIHAIGSGCLICEIQQSSDVTYRLYDYGRLDKNGVPRKLHIDNALEVLNYHSISDSLALEKESEENSDYAKALLCSCKYFIVHKYDVKTKLTLPANEATFKAIVVVDGDGTITNGSMTYQTSKGDTWYCGCDEIIELKGNLKVLIANL